MGVITHQGDAVTWARDYSGPLFHALFCDAPYEMGFMGKDWDRSGVAFNPETWEAFARVLYPGAFLFVAAGTINDDLISVAMREAGLRKFHKVMGWAYGSGFPKASRIDANIEKRRNDEIRHVCRFLESKLNESGKRIKDIVSALGFDGSGDHGVSSWFRENHVNPRVPTWEQWQKLKEILSFNGDMDSEVKRLNDRKGTYGEDWHKREITGTVERWKDRINYEVKTRDGLKREKPATPLAQAWEGHRYGLQAIKPAIETILVFQKPYEGKPIDNITETGAGALWIDGARIPTDDDLNGGVYRCQPDNDKMWDGWGMKKKSGEFKQPPGRWPSNFLLLDSGAAQALDEQSGERRGGEYPARRFSEPGSGRTMGSGWHGKDSGERIVLDSGGASRYFFRVEETIDEADPVFYSAKASRNERETGLFGILPCVKCGNIESETHVNEYGKIVKCVRNSHTTVKPLSLCKYIATLILPPAEYAPRRVFVPFAGVGSEQIGANMAGWEHVEGVELEEEYIPINRARVKYWQGRDLKGKKSEKGKGIKGLREDYEKGRLPIANPRKSNDSKSPDQLELI